MGIVPGQDPGPQPEPLLADEPPPPGVEDFSEDVDAMERRIRERGPEDVEQADRQADAVEGDAGSAANSERSAADEEGVGPGSRSDAGQDPTSDQGADPEDPEAQRGEEPSGSSGD
jgi:hypothetical protein